MMLTFSLRERCIHEGTGQGWKGLDNSMVERSISKKGMI